MVNANDLANILSSQVKATRVGCKDYAEEVFAGIQKGIDSNWRENAIKFVVLIGDASSHELGHTKNTSGCDENSLLRTLQGNNIHV